MSTRLFVSAALSNGARLDLHGEHARHVGRVLRARIGDPVFVFNGDDGEWAAEITSLGKNAVTLLVSERRVTNTESALYLHLVQGISRGERMDFVVQKATELGVRQITPVLTEYGVVKLNSARAAKRLEHWQRIAESACEQSGRVRPPLIDTPTPLNQWFGEARSSNGIHLILQPGAAFVLPEINQPQAKLCLLIGPEGGFSDKEYSDAAAAGFRPVSLGPRILRTETAALAALAVAQSVWGDLRPESTPSRA